LHLENIVEFPVELTTPELCVVHHIHQFRLDDKSVATLNQLTCENSSDMQIATNVSAHQRIREAHGSGMEIH